MIQLVDVDLDHPRGGTPLVSGANLAVEGGEVVMIVGAAGVGTSRLVAALLGEIPLAGGRIDVLGRDVGKLRRSSLRLLRRRVGIVPQDLCLLEDRTAQHNVMLPLEIDGIPRSVSIARANEVLAQLGLEDVAGAQIDSLPPSTRQRVAVARALVRTPDIVIADHPTSAQDALGADLVCTAIAAAAHRGATCLVLGRDPQLRSLGELYRWRQLGLVGGVLCPLDELAVDGRTIDEILVGIESAPLSNVLPFPRSDSRPVSVPVVARVAGAGGVR